MEEGAHVIFEYIHWSLVTSISVVPHPPHHVPLALGLRSLSHVLTACLVRSSSSVARNAHRSAGVTDGHRSLLQIL